MHQGKRHVALNRLRGALRFDGLNLWLQDLRLDAGTQHLLLNGRLGPLFDNPGLDVKYRGTADLAVVSKWFDVTGEPAGVMVFEGSIDGPASNPNVALSLTGADLAWRDLRGLSLQSKATWTAGALNVSDLTARIGDGQLTGRAHITITGDRRPGTATIAWRRLPLHVLQTAIPLELPFSLGASMDGHVDARWNEPRVEALTLTLDNQSRAVSGAGRLDVDGSVAVELRGGGWQARVDGVVGQAMRVVGSAGGRVSADDPGRSTLAGSATITVPDLSDGWRVVDRVAGRSTTAAPELGGDATASLALEGTIGSPRIRGTLRGERIRYGSFGPTSLVAHAESAGGRLDVDAIEAHVASSSLRGAGRVTFTSRAIEGRLDARIADLKELAAGAPEWLGLSGSGVATADVRGTWSAPTLHVRANGVSLAAAGQTADRWSAGLRLGADGIDVETFVLSQPSGELTGKGRYSSADGSYAIAVKGQSLAVRPIPRQGEGEPFPVRAIVDVEFEGSGTVADSHGRGRINASNFDWSGYDVGGLDAEIALVQQSLQVTARMRDQPVAANGTLRIAPFGPFVADVEVANLDLAPFAARFLPAARMSRGSLSAALRGAGDLADPASASLNFNLRALDGVFGDSAPIRLSGPSQLRYVNHQVDVDDTHVQLGDTRLQVGGQMGPDPTRKLTAMLEGGLRDLTFIVPIIASATGTAIGPPGADGSVRATLTAHGDPLDPIAEGEVVVREGRVQVGDVPAASDVAMEVTYRDGAIELRQLTGSWQGARIAASGYVPISVLSHASPSSSTAVPVGARLARLNVRVDSATQTVLAPWLDPATLDRIRAELAGTLTLEADTLSLARARGALELQQAQLTLGGIALGQTQPTRIAIENGRAQIVDWNWAGPGNEIAVRGHVQLDEQPELDLTTDGHIDLALLGALLPDVGTAGQARVSVRAHGPVGKPALDGRIDISQAELRLTDPRLIVTGLAGTLTLAGDRLTTDGLEGTANGGTLRVSGSFSAPDWRQPTGSLVVEGRGIALDLNGLRTEIDGDLRLNRADGRPTLSGGITVRSGAYREPLSLTGGLLAALRQQGVAIDSAEPSLLDGIDLDVRVTSTDDLLVDNNYGQLQMGADLRLVGTPIRPGLIGRATVREGGQIFLGGNTYRIVGDGTIDFADEHRITPTLSISAVTRVSGKDVTLTVKGPPDALRTELSSDPPLGQADLVSLLVTGRTLEQGGGALAIPRDQLLGYLSGEFLGSAGRAVGLDTVRIQRGLPDVQFNAGLVATETDPGARLTFAKDVRPDLQLVFSQSLDQTSGLTWIVSYKVRRNIEARVVSLDNGDRTYDFRHDVSFGGPAPIANRSADRARESVVAIQITGDTVDGTTDLLDRLKLHRGDTFDFFKWQGDRGRLEAFFIERGYYEVRVGATRKTIIDGGTQGVALSYDVHRGPLTTVAVEGAPLPSSTIRELQETWAHATIDQFLIDETTSRVRAHLADGGYLRATVSAAIESGVTEKRLVLRVDAGPRTDRREIRFSGNVRIPTRRLNAFIEGRRLSAVAWADPGQLRTALLTLYRDESMLGASVRVQPVLFEGTTAVLPVDIVEGQEFRIGTVTLDAAVDGLAEQTVRSAIQLKSGDRYSPLQVERARQRLETRYRKSGFTGATAGTTATVLRDAARVDISMSVVAGSRHTLRDVVIAGAARTNAGLISRTLKLDVGQPVDLTSWYEARSRLYDTGVFRRVEIEEEPIDAAQLAGSGISEEPVRAKVTLEERPPLRARYGVQVSDPTKPASDTRQLTLGVAGDLTYRNLFGRAMSAGLAARYDADFRATRAFVTTPALAGRPITSNFFISRSREDLGKASDRPFVTDKTDFTGEQRIRPWRRLELAYSYNFERNHTFDLHPTPGDPLPFDLAVKIARITGTALADARDDLVDATRGWFHSSNVEYAASRFGSDVRFVKIVLQQYYFRLLPGHVVVASAARVGLATGFGQSLIPSERFFAGGGTSVRGFEQDGLGPVDVFGSPAGGNALMVLNQEVRFPVFKWLRGVGFVDAGNVFASVGDLSLGGLRPSLGLGVRIQTPVALVRIDVGAPWSRGVNEPRGRWIFSVGQAF